MKRAPAIDIVTAMNSPALFQRWFPGESWDGWRAVLKAAYALPMTAEEIEFFRSVAEREPPEKQVRELWIIVGRRGGKDSIASLIAAYSAALFQQSDKLRPGERAMVMCLACDKDQARIVLDYTKSYFSGIEALAETIKRETKDGFELENDVDVAVTTNNFKAVRGRPVLLAILDEVAFYQSDTSTSPDIETYRALRPGLATLEGSMLVGISSPYRRSGLLYQKFKDHFGKPGDVLVVKAPSRLLNPTLPQDLIDQALAEDPAAAKAEWLGEFRDDVGGWLPAEVIEAAVDVGTTVRPPRKDFKYVSFCDPSGGARDSFTCAIAHAENDVAVLDCLIEIKAPFNPSEATATIAATLAEYGLRSTTGDRYAAAWVTDGFARVGVDYKHSDRDRSTIYIDAIAMFNSGRVRLLDNRRMVTQFANLERRTSPIGKDRVDHGPGGHDDLCNSAAGALIQLTHKDWSKPGNVYWEVFQREKREMEAGLPADAKPTPIKRTWAVGSVEWERQQRGELGPPAQTKLPTHISGQGKSFNTELDEQMRSAGLIK